MVQLSSIPYFDKNPKINEKYYIWSVLKICKPDPGLLNITFASDMLHLMLMCKIYVANSDMKNVMGMSDPNVMFKRPGPMSINCKVHIIQQQWLVGQAELKLEDLRDICFSSECLIAWSPNDYPAVKGIPSPPLPSLVIHW